MRTKVKILNTTLKLYNEKGVYNVSSRVICNAMNISPGNFSYHYPSMSRLVTELFSHYLEKTGMVDAKLTSVTDYVYERFQLMKIQYDYRFLFLNLFDIIQKFSGIKDLLLLKSEEDNLNEAGRLATLQQQGYLKSDINRNILLQVAAANNRSYRTWLTDAMLHKDDAEVDIRKYLTFCISNSFHYLTDKGIEELKNTGIDVY